MTRIMISYSHDDEHLARRLAELLRKSYDYVWYDEKLIGGIEWWHEILHQIALCDHFIFLISRESMQSRYCLDELAEAHRAGKHIIPIQIRRSIEFPDELAYLKDLQIIKMIGEITTEGINGIYAALVNHQPSTPKYNAEQRHSDMHLLKELLTLIATSGLDRLDYESPYMSEEFDSKKISAYYRLRQHEHHFLNPDLEEAFTIFDQYVLDYLQQVAIAEERKILSDVEHDKRSASSIQGLDQLLQDYEETVSRIAAMGDQYRDLLKIIKAMAPDFAD